MNLHITLPPTLRRGGGESARISLNPQGRFGKAEANQRHKPRWSWEGDASVIFCNVLDVSW